MNCLICQKMSPKYKCPNCRIPYCSINCWTSHKEQKCERLEKQIPELESTLEYYAFRTEDTVPIDQLKLLEKSKGVRNALYNPHVRNILDVIDKSKNPTAALKSAMLEPIFVEFVEECLKVVEPIEDEIMCS